MYNKPIKFKGGSQQSSRFSKPVFYKWTLIPVDGGRYECTLQELAYGTRFRSRRIGRCRSLDLTTTLE